MQYSAKSYSIYNNQCTSTSQSVFRLLEAQKLNINVKS